MNRIDHEQRNLAGLTPTEQVAMNTAGLMLVRELFGKTKSNLDGEWLDMARSKKVAVCAIARLPASAVLTATLSALPQAQREAIRNAVIELDYQREFSCGCDAKVWHPVIVDEEVENKKRERESRLQMRRAVLAACQITQQGPRAIGQ
ncbi:hypothetical protein [Aeromonas veronii]|uniref:hypothetical protein n=1 Tax=Aeromonas veronii TaxID=654 RepID=UPI003D1CFA01